MLIKKTPKSALLLVIFACFFSHVSASTNMRSLCIACDGDYPTGDDTSGTEDSAGNEQETK